MRRRTGRRLIAAGLITGLVLERATTAWAANPEIDRLLQSPAGNNWVTNGGNLTNRRYSTLNQIDRSNVKQLRGAWMTRLKSSGYGGKYSFEATPLVKDGNMYIVTGNPTGPHAGARSRASARLPCSWRSRARLTAARNSQSLASCSTAILRALRYSSLAASGCPCRSNNWPLCLFNSAVNPPGQLKQAIEIARISVASAGMGLRPT
jgi:hypothetical protein